MANPTLLVSQFDGTVAYIDTSGSGTWTTDETPQYDDGLFLEARENLITNPSFEAGLTGWANNGSGTITKTQITDGVDGTKAMRIETDGSAVTQGVYFSSPLIAAVQGDKLRLSVYAKALTGTPDMRLALRIGGAADAFLSESYSQETITGSWPSDPYEYAVTVADAAAQYARFKYFVAGTAAIDIAIDSASLVKENYAISASVATAEPVSVACWYREGYSGAKQFAYLDTLGQLGDYGDVSWAAGDLTISTSRNLVIGPFAAFDRALTAGEQANLRSTQNWTMNSVNGSNIILPLSGARRRRR